MTEETKKPITDNKEKETMFLENSKLCDLMETRSMKGGFSKQK